MAKDKVTISLDRSKADEARALSGARSTSQVVDLALDSFIRQERRRRDIGAYRKVPPAGAEIDLAALGDTACLEDDTNWEALYADEE